MDFKNKLKNFWRMNAQSAKGFTLVELIVVIAILAILAGVAVPAYSGYVEKANKQADQTLVSEVKQALELYHYSNPGATKGYVTLGSEGVVEYDSDSVAKAMEAMFGENWQEVAALKYDGWKGESATLSYAETSYFGSEKRLLNEVDDLTFALSQAIESDTGLIGNKFGDFLKKYDLDENSDSVSISNAAVLYVAQQTADNKQLLKDTIAQTSQNQEKFINNTFNALSSEMGNAAALAAIYAYAEGFAQYCDKQAGNTQATEAFSPDFSLQNGETMDAVKALERLEVAFASLGAVGYPYIDEYMAADGPGLADVAGFIDIMGTVNNNNSIVDGNLNSEECFTDGKVEELLNGFKEMGSMGIKTDEGQIAIAIIGNDNGLVSTYTLPMELN